MNINHTYRPLGDFIKRADKKNKNLKVQNPMGINIDKYFMPSVANIIGTDMTNYKLVSPNQFACNLMHVGRDGKIPVAQNKTPNDILVSPAYNVFEVIDTQKLSPDYLMLWFRRQEFDREASFYTDADVRCGLDFNTLLEMSLPVPSIDDQRRIVSEYETVQRRIDNNRQLINKLEETAQTLYKKMFVEGIDKENLPEGWRMGKIEEFGEVISGATPSTSNDDYWKNGTIVWISPADLSKQKCIFIYKGSKNITKEGYQSASTHLLPQGTVLFSSRAPIGLMGIVDNELCTNQGFKSIVPNQDYGTEFIYMFLHFEKEKIAMQNAGSTFDEISGEQMKNYPAIIPTTEKVSSFCKLAKPLFNQIKLKELEQVKLNELQSLLLAKMGR